MSQLGPTIHLFQLCSISFFVFTVYIGLIAHIPLLGPVLPFSQYAVYFLSILGLFCLLAFSGYGHHFLTPALFLDIFAAFPSLTRGFGYIVATAFFPTFIFSRFCGFSSLLCCLPWYFAVSVP